MNVLQAGCVTTDMAKQVKVATHVSLRELLATDDSASAPGGLTTALGDRYLCANNALYASVRRAFVSYGLTFEVVGSELSTDYFAAPLLMLPEILKTGVVPVADNISVLRRMVISRPAFTVSPGFFATLKRNYVFHESAHCVAYRAMTALAGTVQDIFVLSAVVGEAYANALERIASLQVTSSVERLFYAVNSYIPCSTMNDLWMETIPLLGIRKLLLLGMTVFIRVNLRLPLNAVDIATLVRDQAGETPSEAETLIMRLVADRWSISMGRNFVDETNPNFFGCFGYFSDYERLCAGRFSSDEISLIGHTLSTLADVSC